MGSPHANRYSSTWFDLFLTAGAPAQTEREVAFLVRNLPAAPASILDVCCGYGRHAALLADAGYDVLGVDRDASVIDRARATHPNNRLTFRNLDMTRLGDLPETFDMAICMWQSFGYGDAATNADVLRQMAALLRPDGRLVLDIYNRDFFETRQGERETAQRGERIVTRQRLEGDRLIVDIDYIDRGEGDRFDWQVFTPEEIVSLAERFGLRSLVACMGFDEHLTPLPDQPRMQLVFARA
jgi:SAM-dependent methyltransferase